MKEQILYHQPLPSHQVGRSQPKQSFNRPEKQLPLTAPISPDSTVDSALTFEATGSLLLGGRYSLEERLGSGGMGAVYKAKHIHLKSSHAIKLFSADLIGSDPELITRFRQEAIASAAIRHPNVVAVTDFGLASGNLPFLVMDYVKGRTLESMLSLEGNMSPERALEILSAIAAGVSAAHHKGIIHRDLKPLNIMLQDDLPIRDAVKVLDFGLAKIKSGELLGSFIQARTTSLMGSPYYMAPELWSGAEPDRRTDIYSLGIIIYQMLSGQVPFKGSSPASIMKAHLMSEPALISSWRVEVSWALENVIRHALEKKPENRPDSVVDFIGALRSAHANASTTRPNQGVMPAPEVCDLHNTTPERCWGPDEQRQFILEAQRRFQVEQEPLTRAETQRFYEKTGDQSNEVRERCEAAKRVTKSFGNLTDPGNPLARTQDLSTPHEQSVKANHSMMIEARLQSHPTLSDEPMRNWRHSPSPSPATRSVTHTAIRKRVVFVGGLTVSLVLLIYAIQLVINDRWELTKSDYLSQPSQEPIAPQPLPTSVPLISKNSDNAVSGRAEMIAIPGGTFLMGSNSVPPGSGSPNNQWPAHSVTVASFYIDKNKVTNAEYAEFVRDSGHEPPAGRHAEHSLDGQERWPVTNVSFEDAQAYAQWRSRRDKVLYRLPTEEEWEYAARGHDPENLYPWGRAWKHGYANLGTDSLTPVGSYPLGASREGVLDLIGNAWEWTSSGAHFYPGNKRPFPDKEKGWIVVRGGSYKSQAMGEEAITATSRGWVTPSTRDSKLGFRLVRQDS